MSQERLSTNSGYLDIVLSPNPAKSNDKIMNKVKIIENKENKIPHYLVSSLMSKKTRKRVSEPRRVSFSTFDTKIILKDQQEYKMEDEITKKAKVATFEKKTLQEISHSKRDSLKENLLNYDNLNNSRINSSLQIENCNFDSNKSSIDFFLPSLTSNNTVLTSNNYVNSEMNRDDFQSAVNSSIEKNSDLCLKSTINNDGDNRNNASNNSIDENNNNSNLIVNGSSSRIISNSSVDYQEMFKTVQDIPESIQIDKDKNNSDLSSSLDKKQEMVQGGQEQQQGQYKDEKITEFEFNVNLEDFTADLDLEEMKAIYATNTLDRRQSWLKANNLNDVELNPSWTKSSWNFPEMYARRDSISLIKAHYYNEKRFKKDNDSIENETSKGKDFLVLDNSINSSCFIADSNKKLDTGSSKKIYSDFLNGSNFVEESAMEETQTDLGKIFIKELTKVNSNDDADDDDGSKNSSNSFNLTVHDKKNECFVTMEETQTDLGKIFCKDIQSSMMAPSDSQIEIRELDKSSEVEDNRTRRDSAGMEETRTDLSKIFCKGIQSSMMAPSDSQIEVRELDKSSEVEDNRTRRYSVGMEETRTDLSKIFCKDIQSSVVEFPRVEIESEGLSNLGIDEDKNGIDSVAMDQTQTDLARIFSRDKTQTSQCNLESEIVPKNTEDIQELKFVGQNNLGKIVPGTHNQDDSKLHLRTKTDSFGSCMEMELTCGDLGKISAISQIDSSKNNLSKEIEDDNQLVSYQTTESLLSEDKNITEVKQNESLNETSINNSCKNNDIKENCDIDKANYNIDINFIENNINNDLDRFSRRGSFSTGYASYRPLNTDVSSSLNLISSVKTDFSRVDKDIEQVDEHDHSISMIKSLNKTRSLGLELNSDLLSMLFAENKYSKSNSKIKRRDSFIDELSHSGFAMEIISNTGSNKVTDGYCDGNSYEDERNNKNSQSSIHSLEFNDVDERQLIENLDNSKKDLEDTQFNISVENINNSLAEPQSHYLQSDITPPICIDSTEIHHQESLPVIHSPPQGEVIPKELFPVSFSISKLEEVVESSSLNNNEVSNNAVTNVDNTLENSNNSKSVQEKSPEDSRSRGESLIESDLIDLVGQVSGNNISPPPSQRDEFSYEEMAQESDVETSPDSHEITNDSLGKTENYSKIIQEINCYLAEDTEKLIKKHGEAFVEEKSSLIQFVSDEINNDSGINHSEASLNSYHSSPKRFSFSKLDSFARSVEKSGKWKGLRIAAPLKYLRSGEELHSRRSSLYNESLGSFSHSTLNNMTLSRFVASLELTFNETIPSFNNLNNCLRVVEPRADSDRLISKAISLCKLENLEAIFTKVSSQVDSLEVKIGKIENQPHDSLREFFITSLVTHGSTCTHDFQVLKHYCDLKSKCDFTNGLDYEKKLNQDLSDSKKILQSYLNQSERVEGVQGIPNSALIESVSELSSKEIRIREREQFLYCGLGYHFSITNNIIRLDFKILEVVLDIHKNNSIISIATSSIINNNNNNNNSEKEMWTDLLSTINLDVLRAFQKENPVDSSIKFEANSDLPLIVQDIVTKIGRIGDLIKEWRSINNDFLIGPLRKNAEGGFDVTVKFHNNDRGYFAIDYSFFGDYPYVEKPRYVLSNQFYPSLFEESIEKIIENEYEKASYKLLTRIVRETNKLINYD